MNPLVLIGLGVVAVMATGKKKSEKSERSYSGTAGLQAVKAPKKPKQPKPMAAKLGKIPILDPLAPKLAKIAAPKTSYKTTISKDGPGIARYCHKKQGMKSIEDVARCVASDLFPVSGWPSTLQSEGWERDAWHRIINVARAEFGLSPAPKQAKAQFMKIG